jgi:chitinase
MKNGKIKKKPHTYSNLYDFYTKICTSVSVPVYIRDILLNKSLKPVRNHVPQISGPLLCYYGTWATYRHGNGRCDVDHLDPFVCTHMIYTFFGIETNGAIRIIDPYLDLEENWGRGNIKKFNNLKLLNPKLKTIAAVGGWNEGSNKFSLVAKDPLKRKVFAETSLAFVLQHGFDGLDLDWEYPGQREGSDPEVDKENFVLFLEELHNA